MRVGGGAGIGVKYLARRSAHRRNDRLRRHGAHLPRGVRCVRNIRRAQVYSPSRDHREEYAAEMRASSGSRSSRSTAHARPSRAPTSSRPAPTRCPGLRSGVARAGDARDQPAQPHHEVPNDAANAPTSSCAKVSPGSSSPRPSASRPAAAITGSVSRRDHRRAEAPAAGDAAAEGLREERHRQAPRLRRLRLGRGAGPHRAKRSASTRTPATRGCSSRRSAAGSTTSRALGRGREIPTEWFLQDIRD